jgi:septal ring factor EnvC (AmiA/AmiB activator)
LRAIPIIVQDKKMKRFAILACAALVVFGAAVGIAQVDPDAGYADPGDTRAAMLRAQRDRDAARARAEELEAAAAAAGEATDQTLRQSAALAARIQQAEAAIEVAEARFTIVSRQQRALSARLAIRQQPVVRLTGALQRFSRRPLALSVMRPGSVKEMVYLRALLSSTVPTVQARTAALRGEIELGDALEREAGQALAALRANENELSTKRKELDALASRQALESRQASGAANREAELALALAEEARDLDGLVERLDAASTVRERLAALPGPIIRPPRPAESQVMLAQPPATLDGMPPPEGYQLPVAGRTVTGFGAPAEGGGLSKGLALAPREGAQVVAPAAGRVVFAGPYRGYGRIVILEHEGGWTSLVTGLARIDVAVGTQLLGGSPLGIAAQRRPLITLELRRGGQPVNPLEFLG